MLKYGIMFIFYLANSVIGLCSRILNQKLKWAFWSGSGFNM